MIIIRGNKFVELEQPLPKVGIQGVFTLEKKKGGILLPQKREFTNLITDTGLDRFGFVAANNLYNGCLVGTGTSPAQPTDTVLGNYVAGVTANLQFAATRGANNVEPYYGWMRATYTFPVGGAVGNFTEVGIAGGSASDSPLFSRALIVDSNDEPVAFPVLSDEQLVVTYELRLMVPTVDVTEEVTISGIGTIDATSRASKATNTQWAPLTSAGGINIAGTSANQQMIFTGGLGDITGVPVGVVGKATTSNIENYVTGTYQRKRTNTYGPAEFNRSDVRTFLFSWSVPEFQVEYEVPLAKNSEQTLILNHTTSWARV